MARITIEDCLKNVSNRFLIVQMANLRIKQHLKGSKPLVNAPDNNTVVVAMREIAASKVRLDEKTKHRLNEEQENTLDAE